MQPHQQLLYHQTSYSMPSTTASSSSSQSFGHHYQLRQGSVAPQAPEPKCVRRSNRTQIPLEIKVRIIKAVEENIKYSDIMEKYGLTGSSSTISGIYSKRSEYLRAYAESSSGDHEKTRLTPSMMTKNRISKGHWLEILANKSLGLHGMVWGETEIQGHDDDSPSLSTLGHMIGAFYTHIKWNKILYRLENAGYMSWMEANILFCAFATF